MGANGQRKVLRAQSSRSSASFVWVACCAFVGVSIVSGGDSRLLRFGHWVGLAAWAAFAVLWRPCIIVDADDLTMINVLKTHRIPFARITDLKVGMTVSVEAGGRRYSSWGAPMPRSAYSAGLDLGERSQIQVMTPTNERLRATSAADPARDSIRRAWEDAKRSPSTHDDESLTSSTWNAASLVVGAVCLLLIGVTTVL
ncbi:hypothetical protein [Sinomonas sp. ASV322]|uniref:hypothetical protein n=1 Tax=Sinomonas sp. ASV322 TaxID=3041920 RepID=UPI0027DAB68E|nr:hypothetical protein [Sinomonas sp. ASV322]MDQ4501716.1 hypothetical protein [Sinomonas sp. ASV322]